MIRQGEKLIVWDSTVQDMYTAIAAQTEHDELAVNPLVRICGVVIYPMQHAAMFPDTASEHAPLPEGTVCRLKLVCKGWLCFNGDYPTTLAQAREQMAESLIGRIEAQGNRLYSVTAAAARTEVEILERHRHGETAPRTVMGANAPFTLPSGGKSDRAAAM